MKKSDLKNIIKEVILEEKGYSRYVPGGTTNGLTKKTLDKILLRIANGEAEVTEDDDEDQIERGNKILDKADPKNVARILRGEKPLYEEEVDRMQELAGIQSEIKVNNPNNIPFENLKIGNKYNLTWNDGDKEENEDIKIIDFDSDGNEKWAMIEILTNREEWVRKTGIGNEGEGLYIQLFPEDIISIRNA